MSWLKVTRSGFLLSIYMKYVKNNKTLEEIPNVEEIVV